MAIQIRQVRTEEGTVYLLMQDGQLVADADSLEEAELLRRALEREARRAQALSAHR